MTSDRECGPLTTPTHGMVPGSHERPGGPTCLCGGPWLYWSDRCRWWKTNDEAADAREQS